MRNIENQAFYSKELSKQIETFNTEADKLTTERQTLEGELGGLRAQALSGDVSELAGLSKRREGLKGKLLTCLIDSVKLAGTRGGFQSAITAAYADEKAKRETALANRTEEIEQVFQRHGLSTRCLQGVMNETTAGLKNGVRDVVNAPKIETEADRATVLELRNKIAELMA
jgi:hypothetical protein